MSIPLGGPVGFLLMHHSTAAQSLFKSIPNKGGFHAAQLVSGSHAEPMLVKLAALVSEGNTMGERGVDTPL